jgi:hypothetical protein
VAKHIAIKHPNIINYYIVISAMNSSSSSSSAAVPDPECDNVVDLAKFVDLDIDDEYFEHEEEEINTWIATLQTQATQRDACSKTPPLHLISSAPAHTQPKTKLVSVHALFNKI